MKSQCIGQCQQTADDSSDLLVTRGRHKVSSMKEKTPQKMANLKVPGFAKMISPSKGFPCGAHVSIPCTHMLLWIEHKWLGISNVVTFSIYLKLHFIALMGMGDLSLQRTRARQLKCRASRDACPAC